MNSTDLRAILEKAITDKSQIKIDYVDSKFQITNARIVEPLELQNWVLIAKDIAKDGIRQFHFDGIQSVDVIEQP